MMNRNCYNIVFAILLNLVAILYGVPAYANFSYQYGDYTVSIIEDTGPDWNADGIGDFYIYHPTDMTDGQHPIIVLCVGTGAHPETSYGDFIREYASHGFVLIAGTDPNQREGDQAVCGLDYIISENSNPDSIFYNKLDTSNIMSIGHSQGGNACLHVALKDPRVTAVMSMMPAKGDRIHVETADASKLVVPVFYITASHDRIVWPFVVRKVFYENTTNTDAWFIELKDTGHSDCPEGISIILRAWVFAQLYHDPTAMALFTNDDWSFNAPFAEKISYSGNSLIIVGLSEPLDVLNDFTKNWQRIEHNFQ